MDSPRIDNRDWSALTLGERIHQIEVEGYLLIPNQLTPDHIAQLKEETAKLEIYHTDYSVHQRGHKEMEKEAGLFVDLIAHPPMVAFLKELFGEDIRMSHYTYSRSEPGHPSISLHTDGQPYGSKIFGFEGSVPCMVRVLYYLDDLTPDISPFRVVPRSHLSMHRDGNPYKRYNTHPEEVMVTGKAGDAVLISHTVFHGNYPNTGDRPREMLAIAYRPAWAGPVDKVDGWDPELVATLPEAVRPFFGDRNSREWDWGGRNKPPNMTDEAPGIDPSRWERK